MLHMFACVTVRKHFYTISLYSLFKIKIELYFTQNRQQVMSSIKSSQNVGSFRLTMQLDRHSLVCKTPKAKKNVLILKSKVKKEVFSFECFS